MVPRRRLLLATSALATSCVSRAPSAPPVVFWLRRSLDGTMSAFAEGLEKLVGSYQPELLEEP